MGFYKPEDKDYVLNLIRKATVAYASMEIGLDPRVHTYSGGLGILAGDTLQSCADLSVEVVGLTLLYRKGYFTQVFENGYQKEADEPWDVDAFTIPIPEGRTSLFLDGRQVWIEPRIGIIVGHDQRHIVPVLFLDSFVEGNWEEDKWLTAYLYGGDQKMRLKQEAILGIAGKRVLRKLNARNVHTFHMNEGHAAFAPMEDVLYLSRYYSFNPKQVVKLVKSGHVFTTHTPVPAGHDKFSFELMHGVLGQDDFAWGNLDLGGHSECNMTKLALNLSRFANGVAQKHGEVSRRMFPGYDIDAITNGVHLPSWVCEPMRTLLDQHMPSWREEPRILQQAPQVIATDEIWRTHQDAKRKLLDFVKERTGRSLAMDRLTIGFARRFAAYKRGDLLFTDLERFKSIARGKMQFVFSGEAHPRDAVGKEIIKRVIAVADQLKGDVDVVFLPDYGMEISRLMVSGCDVWQNNPVPPQEASGTSGMKATANGVPNLSTLDGWWIEGITRNPDAGWTITHRMDGQDHLSLYDCYGVIINLFYNNPQRWREHMIHALTLASYFNTHRMVKEYLDKAWTLRLY